MSSFPIHVNNIKALKNIGFDVDRFFDGDEVDIEFWSYDDLTYLISDIVEALEVDGFEVSHENN